MSKEAKGGEISYNTKHTDYNIKSIDVDDYLPSVEFSAIKELLCEEDLIYTTEFIRSLLSIKKKNDLSCFQRVNAERKAYQKEYGKKTLLYVRLSVEDVEKKDTSVSKSILNQLLLLLQYCRDNEMQVVGIFYEEDISGGTRTVLSGISR